MHNNHDWYFDWFYFPRLKMKQSCITFLIWERKSWTKMDHSLKNSSKTTKEEYTTLQNMVKQHFIWHPLEHCTRNFIKGRQWRNWLAVEKILPAWFDHVKELFVFLNAQFKTFCPPGKTSCILAENVNANPFFTRVKKCFSAQQPSFQARKVKSPLWTNLFW